MPTVFVPGLQLSRAFYTEAVRPLLADVQHTAARIGSGSEVLGFDLLAAVTDPAVAALPRVGAIDQHTDNTDLLTDVPRRRAVAQAALAPS
jgi:hypothetical protein